MESVWEIIDRFFLLISNIDAYLLDIVMLRPLTFTRTIRTLLSERFMSFVNDTSSFLYTMQI